MELLKNLEGMSADEQMTAVVELQKAAMKQLEEQKQVSIGKSAEMVIQGLKKIKSDFEAKFDSLNYDIQAKVANLKDGEQGIQGPKGDQGDRGLDGANGRDGRDGKDGRDGLDGVDGVGVRDAKIDFDGSLVISLTDGREINCGEVVSVDVAKQIQKVTHNIQTGAGGDSQTVLDAIAAIQATIATYGTMATQNKTSVDIEGGTIDNTVIGGTTPAAGTFTTLTATGQTSLGGASGSESVIFPVSATSGSTVLYAFGGASSGTAGSRIFSGGSATNSSLNFGSKGSSGLIRFFTSASDVTGTWSNNQFQVSHTASAVNYVQVTGAATTASPVISAQGSDTNIPLTLNSKGNNGIIFQTRGAGTPRVALQLLDSGSASVNYLQIQSNISGAPAVVSALGSDTNIGMAFISKGTGAIDLAAGSSGVNISNGGTVTAITFTNTGSGYTSVPTATVSAPTTAGGVQATISFSMQLATTPTITDGGTGYTVGNVLTLVGGTFTTAATVTVSTVSAGVITGITVSSFGAYTVLPTSPASVTGGTGSGATFTTSWSVRTTFPSPSITNAGSGYVEQPTVSFSGGGGSGAAAYATVGGTPVIRSLGTNLDFYTPGGVGFRVGDNGTTNAAYWTAYGGPTAPVLRATTTASGIFQTSGAYPLVFQTNFSSEQLRVAHTASAVNYVQVTGAVTGPSATTLPNITVQGSDTNTYLAIGAKGTGGYISFHGNASTSNQVFRIATLNAAGNSSYLQVNASASGGNGPVISAIGSDTNIDLNLTPKGTGNVRFGTYTANMALTVQGYIEVKDSGGTVRKLAVIA